MFSLAGKLAGARGLKFVGGRVETTNQGQTPTYSLTGLTGGIASAPKAGDLVIALLGARVDSGGRNIEATSAGWTRIQNLGATGVVSGIRLAVFYKYLTAADTTVAFNTNGTISSATSHFAAHVWSQADDSSPMDAASTSTQNAGQTSPNPPSITTVTKKAVVIGCGATSWASGTVTYTIPSNTENDFQTGASGLGSIVLSSKLIDVAGAYNPDAFIANVADNANHACVAATVAIRPR